MSATKPEIRFLQVKKPGMLMLRAVSAPPRNARVAFSCGNQCYFRKFDNFEANVDEPEKSVSPEARREPEEPREGATRTAKAGRAEPHRSFRATKKNTLTCVSGTLPPAALLARRVARPERTRFVFFFSSS